MNGARLAMATMDIINLYGGDVEFDVIVALANYSGQEPKWTTSVDPGGRVYKLLLMSVKITKL